MKKIKHLSVAIVVIAALFQTSFGQDKEVAVSGSVTDSAGTAIADAMVILSSGISVDPLSADTVYTATDGSFTKKVTVNQNAYGIAYRVLKDGYTTRFGYGAVDSTNIVDLGTIILAKGNSQKITVSGRVLDSITGTPIEKAMVRLSGTVSITDTVYDSVYTDTDGKFSHEVTVGPWIGIQSRLIYLVTRDGYESKYGNEMIQGTSIDLGDIKLFKNSVSITYNNPTGGTLAGQNTIDVFSIKGQLLFSGKESNFKKQLLKNMAHSQPLIIRYRINKKLMYQKKIILINQ